MEIENKNKNEVDELGKMLAKLTIKKNKVNEEQRKKIEKQIEQIEKQIEQIKKQAEQRKQAEIRQQIVYNKCINPTMEEINECNLKIEANDLHNKYIKSDSFLKKKKEKIDEKNQIRINNLQQNLNSNQKKNGVD